MGGGVQRLDASLGIVDLAASLPGLPGLEPCVDGLAVGRGQDPVGLRADLAVADLDGGDRLHLDPLVAAVIAHAEDHCAIVAETEVIGRQVRHC